MRELQSQLHLRDYTAKSVMRSRLVDVLVPFALDIDSFLAHFRETGVVMTGSPSVEICLGTNFHSDRLTIQLLFHKHKAQKFMHYLTSFQGYTPSETTYTNPSDPCSILVQRFVNHDIGKGVDVIESATSNPITPSLKFVCTCKATFISSSWYCIGYSQWFRDRVAVMFAKRSTPLAV